MSHDRKVGTWRVISNQLFLQEPVATPSFLKLAKSQALELAIGHCFTACDASCRLWILCGSQHEFWSCRLWIGNWPSVRSHAFQRGKTNDAATLLLTEWMQEKGWYCHVWMSVIFFWLNEWVWWVTVFWRNALFGTARRWWPAQMVRQCWIDCKMSKFRNMGGLIWHDCFSYLISIWCCFREGSRERLLSAWSGQIIEKF